VAGLPSIRVTTERQTDGAARHWAPRQGPAKAQPQAPDGGSGSAALGHALRYEVKADPVLAVEPLGVVAVTSRHRLRVLDRRLVALSHQFDRPGDADPVLDIVRVVDQRRRSGVPPQVRHPSPTRPAIEEQPAVVDLIVHHNQVRRPVWVERGDHRPLRSVEKSSHRVEAGTRAHDGEITWLGQLTDAGLDGRHRGSSYTSVTGTGTAESTLLSSGLGQTPLRG
jgi:hypothetical protein